MKIYKVKVNGKVYEVELENVTESDKKIVAEAPTAAAAPTSGDKTVDTPLQGKVFKMLVNVGDVVKSGDVVAVIESMKMENEIQTSQSGTVKSVLVNVGSEVDSNQPLIVIE